MATKNSVQALTEQYLQMSEADLKHNYDLFFPGGSGPLMVMRHTAALILAVASLRGIDTTDW